MGLVVRHSGHLIWMGLLVCCLIDLGASLEFTGAEGQWARFPMWNACCESEMSFNMKTKSSHGLLVYFDDEGFCDFLELLIHNGKLSLRFSIFCAEPAMVLSDTGVDDNNWHSVIIKRNFKNTTLMVDREVKWVEVKSKRRDMTVFSHLFLGGIPPELRTVALRLTSAAVKDQVPFKGWITELKVNSSETMLISSEGVLNVTDPCGRDNLCLNGGICSVVNKEAICDCSQTGYQGKDCSEGISSFCLPKASAHTTAAVLAPGINPVRSPQSIMTTVWIELSRVHLWGLQVGTLHPWSGTPDDGRPRSLVISGSQQQPALQQLFKAALGCAGSAQISESGFEWCHVSALEECASLRFCPELCRSVQNCGNLHYVKNATTTTIGREKHGVLSCM
ncbi:NR1AA protein, partial [Polyodon spathula]|nr:NR1AA protein [Polyodon spathula]